MRMGGGKGSGNYVTDGPFLFLEAGKIKMIWSSFVDGKYAVLEAESERLFGEWKHFNRRFKFDGGHAMVFTDLNGEKKIALHAPNSMDLERLTIYSY